jgi:hypothetical protein
MVKFVVQNWQNHPHNSKAKSRFEVLFKKFHPRINLTTLISTKSCLLNTIKVFSGHKNRSLTKSQKPLQGGTLRYLNFKILSMQDIKFTYKTPEARFVARTVGMAQISLNGGGGDGT